MIEHDLIRALPLEISLFHPRSLAGLDHSDWSHRSGQHNLSKNQSIQESQEMVISQEKCQNIRVQDQ